MAASEFQSDENAADVALLKEQFNQIVAENDSKWQLTNRHVAPFYAGWPVRVIAVVSDGGEAAAELPFALAGVA